MALVNTKNVTIELTNKMELVTDSWLDKHGP